MHWTRDLWQHINIPCGVHYQLVWISEHGIDRLSIVTSIAAAAVSILQETMVPIKGCVRNVHTGVMQALDFTISSVLDKLHSIHPPRTCSHVNLNETMGLNFHFTTKLFFGSEVKI